MITPFVKWAGGKRQLLEQLNKRLPEHWNTYFEPFFGGGALLAHLHNQGKISHAVISDLNSELVNLYRVVKVHPDRLIVALLDEEFKNNEYSYNQLKIKFNDLIKYKGNKVERAALLVYLNKHGYNGLWRVNSKGKFNVPFGRYEKRSLPSESSILAFSEMLRNVTILNADFETTVRSAKKQDFIYFDPPYHPLSKTARFTDYNSSGFNFEDQERLANLFKKLSKKGVQIMLSNSKIQEIEELYAGFAIEYVEAKRFINCNGKRRNGTLEIIVTNYEY